MGGTIGPAPLLPRREDPSVANIIAGFCTTGFLPVSLFLEIMATGLKRKPPPPPEPHRTGMLVRLLAKILCLPSQTSFVTICFAFVLEFLPSNLPRFRRERIQRKARAGSPPLFADFEGYNGHDKISLWTINLMIFAYIYIGRVMRSNLIEIFSFQISFDVNQIIENWKDTFRLNFYVKLFENNVWLIN